MGSPFSGSGAPRPPEEIPPSPEPIPERPLETPIEPEAQPERPPRERPFIPGEAPSRPDEFPNQTEQEARSNDMTDRDAVLHQIEAELGREPRIDRVRQNIRLLFAGGALVVEGKVTEIAAKRLIISHAAAIPDVTSVDDQLQVTPAEAITDSELRDRIRAALVGEPALAGCEIEERVTGRVTAVRARGTASGRIRFSVRRGNVMLEGEVPSLTQRRLASVVAWWAPGTCNVVNNMTVRPAENDSTALLAEAVRTVLDKDPGLHAERVQVTARDGAVILDGMVLSETDKVRAERDAWYVDGVGEVVNRLHAGR